MTTLFLELSPLVKLAWACWAAWAGIQLVWYLRLQSTPALAVSAGAVSAKATESTPPPPSEPTLMQIQAGADTGDDTEAQVEPHAGADIGPAISLPVSAVVAAQALPNVHSAGRTSLPNLQKSSKRRRRAKTHSAALSA